jgi:hypothetical protein
VRPCGESKPAYRRPPNCSSWRVPRDQSTTHYTQRSTKTSLKALSGFLPTRYPTKFK